MALVTLSGTISESDLDNNFTDHFTALENSLERGYTYHQGIHSFVGFTSATDADLLTTEWTQEYDEQLISFALHLSEGATAGIKVTATLECIAENDSGAFISFPIYLQNQTVSIFANTIVGTTLATSTYWGVHNSSTTQPHLISGARYRVRVVSDTAVNAVDRANVILTTRVGRAVR